MSSSALIGAARELLQQELPYTTRLIVGELVDYAVLLEKAYGESLVAEKIAQETAKAVWRAKEKRNSNPGQPNGTHPVS